MNYLNAGDSCRLFREAVNSNIYIDKSMLIDNISSRIRTGEKFICITRPRRFGKTINANMLAAFYTKEYDSTELFSRLKIAKCPACKTHQNQYKKPF